MVFSTAPIMVCIFLVGVSDEAVTGLSIIFKLISNVGWFIMWVQCMEVTLALQTFAGIKLTKWML